MSDYYEAKAGDFSFGRKVKVVDIYVTEDELDSIFLSLTYDQIKELYEKIKDKL